MFQNMFNFIGRCEIERRTGTLHQYEFTAIVIALLIVLIIAAFARSVAPNYEDVSAAMYRV
jgi:hypothetical protein